MNKKTQITIAALTILFLISLLYDAQLVQFIESQRIPLLNDFMYLVTNTGLYTMLGILGTWLIATRRYKELLLLAGVTLLSLESAYILKKLFQLPRPEEITTQLTHATGYTFPSIHAAVVFSIVPFCRQLFKNKYLEYTTIFLLVSIAISRTYLGVHYLSDIFFGGLMGYTLAHTAIFLENRWQVAERFIYNLINEREIRRQTAHLVAGLLIILLIKLNLLTVHMLGGLLIVGGALSIISRFKKIPYIYPVLVAFERPQDLKSFPGKGSFFLVLGSYLVLLIFPQPIALAAIAIMAVGDSITTLIGIYYGRIKSPLNKLKHLEGTMLAIIAGTIMAFNFVPFEKAFLGAIVAMIFENIAIRHIAWLLDDNLLIPLVAAITMTLVM